MKVVTSNEDQAFQRQAFHRLLCALASLLIATAMTPMAIAGTLATTAAPNAPTWQVGQMQNNSTTASASYNVNVVNTVSTTTNVSVSILLPQGLWPAWSGARNTGNFSCTYTFNQASHQYAVTCTDTSMANGASQTANIPVWVDQLATGSRVPAITVSGNGAVIIQPVVTPVTVNGVAVVDSADNCPALLGTRGPNQFANNGTFGTLGPSDTVGSAGAPSNSGGQITGGGTTTLAFDGTGQINDGEYRLANRVSSQVSQRDLAWYWTVGDHSTLGNPPGPSGSGNPNGLMMVINANVTPSVFYQQTLTVQPYTNYEFSAWSTHANNPAHAYWGGAGPPLPYNLAFAVNRMGVDDDGDGTVDESGEQQVLITSGNITASAIPTWRQNAALFNSGAATQVAFIFRNAGPGGDGNDLALDDLLLSECSGLPSANVAGTLYYDDNRNDTLDGAEAGRLPANISVDLINSNGIVVAQAITDANGNYLFQNIPVVPNANYTVRLLTTDSDIPANVTLGTANPVAVTLAAGTTATVNFGYDRSSITIVKDAVPNGSQDFGFTTTGDGLSGFSLDDDADGTLPNTRSFGPLAPGSRTVTEAIVTGWSLTGLVCVDPDNGSTVNLSSRTATIDLDAGENITCTFTNTFAQADLSITKTNTPTAGPNDQAADTVTSGATTTYDIVVSNAAGSATVANAVLRDPAPTGAASCVLGAPACAVTTGTATCPTVGAAAGQLSVANLQASGGVLIPSMNAGSSLTFKLTCTVQ